MTVQQEGSRMTPSVPPESLRISVVLPVYNCAATLEQCLVALLSQVEEGDEVIVVDNNSTDRSRQIAESVAGTQLLSADKQGAYAARNVGCNAATGEILAFIDPDCVPCPGWRRATAASFEDDSIGLIVGSRLPGGASRPLTLISLYEEVKTAWVYQQDDPTLYYAFTNNLAVRRDLWTEIGPFVERQRGADTIFARQAIDRFGPPIALYVPEMSVRHLELDSLPIYLQKMRTYGRSHGLMGEVIQTRTLGLQQKLRVFQQTVEDHQLSLAATALLGGTLFVGSVSWSLGHLSARWHGGSTE